MTKMDQQSILQMVSDGKITAQEGAQLLEALGETEMPAAPVPVSAPARTSSFDTPAAVAGKGKFLRVIVDGKDEKNDEIDVDINVPIKLARRLGPMLEKMIPEDAQTKMNEKGVDMVMILAMLETLDEDMEGRDLANVTVGSGEDTMRVRIYVE